MQRETRGRSPTLQNIKITYGHSCVKQNNGIKCHKPAYYLLLKATRIKTTKINNKKN